MYSCSLIGKYAFIGLTCETEVKAVVGLTKLPICTCAIPAMPFTRDVTCVKSRFNCACSTWASAAFTEAFAARFA